ncbi:DoxX family protein [Mariniphaga sediminis]|uniref:DoxX family protein n=1 Tax=Mariniphaga sediminis TaxID=1628158 RepID=A0A399D4C8_9BACT|nr:DoxX family protein [Mariniphaga sediminis]RIH64230.1 DoxX family protein [Mariniphaga sediminis]RIH66509.1 DoxX family protein [Mariniphaga sediminis]
MNSIKKIGAWLWSSDNDNRSMIPRIIVGLVFLSEGIQKFLYPEMVGVGRFENIGFENPEFWAYFVASFEVVCGVFILTGLLTRLATIPLLTIMATALITTKIPILLNEGFWFMAHAARTDFAMAMLLIFLLVNGPGKFSADYKFFHFPFSGT